MTRFRLVSLVVALALASALVSSCSSSAKHATATTTTLSTAQAAHAYTAPGPYPVGITTLTLSGGVKIEVWYPAVPGSVGQDTYDVRALAPPTVRKLLTANIPATYTVKATHDALVANGQFPLVLYSHGFSSFRQASSFLTSHLASWGMIVAAPDHWSRDLYHVLDGVLGGKKVKANDPVDDLRLTRKLIETENTDPTSLFKGHVDTAHIAAVGHSAGGPTVVGFAQDPGVAGYVSMASGYFGGRTTSTTATATTTPAMPEKPSLFVAGSLDHVAPFATVTKPAYDAAAEPSRLWVIQGSGHNAFDDVCTFGNGKGLIGVAEASGLGGFLDAQPQFRMLGDDGCIPPAVSVTKTFPIIDHVVTAWLRHLFGIDAVPVGLGPEVENSYVVPVAISSKP